MPTKRRHGSKGRNAAATEEADELFKIRFEDALGDQQITTKLASIIRSTNQDLLDNITSLRSEVRSLRKELGERDAAIASLQSEVQVLRQENDALEQYGRRNNLRISGIAEVNLGTNETEDTTAAIVSLANEVLKVEPPLAASDIEVSHRLQKPRNARSGEPRPIIVRFRSKAERYRVISNRKNLKSYNEDQDFKVYINEDLTAARAKLFSTVRKLQKQKHFAQVWTYNGNIRVKDLQGSVKPVKNADDIKKYLPHVTIEWCNSDDRYMIIYQYTWQCIESYMKHWIPYSWTCWLCIWMTTNVCTWYMLLHIYCSQC